MFWPVRFVLIGAWRLKLIVMAAAAGFAVGMLRIIREEQRSWGISPSDARRAMPGDDLIAVPDISETRSLRIDASPDAVWPWLTQMGFGRGGWYSYDSIDMMGSSANELLPEYGELAEGDLVPTHATGGFEVRVVDPDQALVLYLDSELVERQLTSAEAEAELSTEEEPAALQAAGVLGGVSMSEFRATWAFELVPEADGSTRLVERMRFLTTGDGPMQQLSLPFMGMGVFVMTRKHMLGIKERAERLAREQG